MAKDGRIARSLSLGLTSILTGMLLINMNRDKVEAKENHDSNLVDENIDSRHRITNTNSANKINKVIVESDSFSIKKNSQEYDADPSLKMVGLTGLKNKSNHKSDF